MKGPGQLIRGYREGGRLSLRALARLSGISPAHLSGIETDRLTPSPHVAKQLFFHLSLPYEQRRDCCEAWSSKLRAELYVWDQLRGEVLSPLPVAKATCAAGEGQK